MKKLIILANIVLALMGGMLHAQEEESTAPDSKEPPKGELLKRAPKFSRWTISYIYPKNSKDAPGNENPNRIIQVTVVKTVPIFRTVIFFQNGTKEDSWFDGQMKATKRVQDKNYSVENIVNRVSGSHLIETSLETEYKTSDFPDLGWISLKTFIGRKKNFLVFADTSAKKGAYINDETRLPARLIMNGATMDFQFEELPHTIQAPPDEVKRILDEMEKTSKLISGRALP